MGLSNGGHGTVLSSALDDQRAVRDAALQEGRNVGLGEGMGDKADQFVEAGRRGAGHQQPMGRAVDPFGAHGQGWAGKQRSFLAPFRLKLVKSVAMSLPDGQGRRAQPGETRSGVERDAGYAPYVPGHRSG